MNQTSRTLYTQGHIDAINHLPPQDTHPMYQRGYEAGMFDILARHTPNPWTISAVTEPVQ